MRHRPGGERGVAALELALMLVLLFALVAVCLPLGVAVVHRVALDQATEQTLRFATTAPNTPELGASSPPCRRPSTAEVASAAQQALAVDGGGSVLASFSITPDSGSAGCSTNPPGTRVAVSLVAPVNLGAVGQLLHIVGLSVPATMTADAFGREE